MVSVMVYMTKAIIVWNVQKDKKELIQFYGMVVRNA